MPRIPFNGDFYTSKSKLANAQRTVNWFTESDPTGKNKLIAYPTPGLTLKATIGNGPIRGMMRFIDTTAGNAEMLYVVSGTEVYKVSTAWGATLLGTIINSSADPVSIANNGHLAPGQEAIFVDGTKGYRHLNATSTWVSDITTNDSTNFPDGATHVVFFDGLFLANDVTGATSNQSGAFMWSDSYTASVWQALNFATAERSPDSLLAISAVNKIIYLFGEFTTELWYNASGSDATTPFKPQTTIGVGIKAPHTIARTGDSLIWLSTDENGMARVTIATGNQTKAVSTYALENEWNSYSDLSDAYAFIYEQDGHTFYELTFPTGDRTFVYDLLQNSWHERESYNGGAGGKHKVRHSAFFNGLTIVGDDSSGKLYAYDTDVHQDNAVQIVRQRDTQHISSDTNVSVRHNRLTMEFESGVGSAEVSSTNTTNVTGQVADTTAPFVAGDVGKTIYNTITNESSTIAAYITGALVSLTDSNMVMTNGDTYVMGVDPQVELYWSDDRGAVWKGPIYRTLGLSGDTIKKVSFANLGISKDRIYRIKGSDNANYTLVGAYLDVMGGSDES